MRRTPALRPCRRGFTLVELLVVIVILGILMAVAVPTFLRQQAKAQDSRTQQYLTTAFKAIRSGLPDTGNVYPQSTSMVSWIQQSEPELAAQSGSCSTQVQTAPQDAVLVDPASTPTSLVLCARSQSGNVFKLTATNTGVQQLLDGTLVPLTFSGNEITDATRAADVQGDGLSSDSSAGIWESTTNLNTNGGAETNTASWTAYSVGSLTRDTSTAMFGAASFKATWPGGSPAWYGMQQTWDFGVGAVPAAAVGDSYTMSGWFKAATPGFVGKTIRLLLRFSGGANPQKDVTTVVTLGSGWTYWSATNAVDYADRTQINLFLIQNDVPAVGDGFYVDGLQLEKKTLATPYVETNGATAARGRSAITAPISLLSGQQGWVAMRVRMLFPSTQDYNGDGAGFRQPNFFSLTDGTLANRIHIFYYSGNHQWNIIVNRNNVGVQIPPASGNSFAADTVLTVIGKWTSSQAGISINGAAFTTNSVGAGSWPTSGVTLTIGGFHSNDMYQADADFLWFATGTGALTDADAATINGFGSADPKVSAFPAAAQTTMVWNGSSTSGSLK